MTHDPVEEFQAEERTYAAKVKTMTRGEQRAADAQALLDQLLIEMVVIPTMKEKGFLRQDWAGDWLTEDVASPDFREFLVAYCKYREMIREQVESESTLS